MKLINHIIPVLIIPGFLIFNSSCCNRSDTNRNEHELTAEIDLVISRWHSSATASDHTAYIGAMSSDGVYIGTDATEYWTTPEFSAWSKPYFDQKKGWSLKKVNRNIYLGESGKFAWFDELLDTGMGLCRGSGVLQKSDGKWKIYQYVLSPTVPNELTYQVKTLKSGTDSLLIRQYGSASHQ